MYCAAEALDKKDKKKEKDFLGSSNAACNVYYNYIVKERGRVVTIGQKSISPKVLFLS